MSQTSPMPGDTGGCLRIWLVLLLLALGIGSIAYFYVGVVLSRAAQGEQGTATIVLSILFSAGAVGAGLMLARRRIGFYLLAAAFVSAAVLQFVISLRIELALAGVFNLVLVWWLARPVWARLE